MIRYYFWILCLLPLTLSAQDEATVQQLEKQAHKTKGKERVRLFNQLSETYQNIEPQKARQYAYEALALAKELNMEVEEALAYKNMGVVYHLQGNNSQALEYFLKARQVYEKIKNEDGIAHTLHDIGAVYQDLEKYEEAQKLLQSSP